MGSKPRAASSSLSTLAPERLEGLRALCLSFAGAAEKEAWGDPTWRVKGRIFAMQKGNYAGGRPSVWFKGAAGAQAMLVDANPESYFVPSYVGHKGWIGVFLDLPTVDWEELTHLVELSYDLVAKK